jgi:hypothetical protein
VTALRRTFAVALGSALVWAAVASAGGSRQSASVHFTTEVPRSSTGLETDIDYVNPDDPSAKPPAVRQVVIRLARRARIDTSVPEPCTATDAQLMALGEAACPAGSNVGEGLVTVDTGFPGTARFVTAEVDLFNNANELIYLNTVQGTSVRTVVRAEVTRRTIVTNPPMLPGTPPDGGAIDTVDLDIAAIVDQDGRPYVRTPRLCRLRGFWRNRISFTTADGVTQEVTTRSPCEPNRPR